MMRWISLAAAVWALAAAGDAPGQAPEAKATKATSPGDTLSSQSPIAALRLTTLEGEATLHGGSGISTNGLLHDEVLGELARG